MLVTTVGYWPINSEVQPFKYPEAFRAVFEQFEEEYQMKKEARELEMHNNLGLVELSLEFKQKPEIGSGMDEEGVMRSFDFKCQPVQAVLISYFDEESGYSSEEGRSVEWLAQELEATVEYI